MKYNLEIGQIVYYKCRVTNILDNCIVYVEGVNVGEKDIKFMVHPNSLISKQVEPFRSINFIKKIDKLLRYIFSDKTIHFD